MRQAWLSRPARARDADHRNLRVRAEPIPQPVQVGSSANKRNRPPVGVENLDFVFRRVRAEREQLDARTLAEADRILIARDLDDDVPGAGGTRNHNETNDNSTTGL